MNLNSKWHQRYLELASLVASWSKDPSTQVGAVVIGPGNKPRSFGFNGFPRGLDDHPEKYLDKEYKHRHVMHAEENAILNAQHSLQGCVLYVTHPPCNHCAGAIVQAGISEVCFYKPSEEIKEKFYYTDTLKVLISGGVKITTIPTILEN